jgi:acylphosphatase
MILFSVVCCANNITIYALCAKDFGEKMVSAFIRVTGRVQGVGYRYFAMRQANLLGISGYVKNKSDGSVELEVEGNKEIIENFRSILEQGPGYGSVDNVEVRYEPYSAKYKKFSVDY